jgi:prevent-host-death family protein
MLVNVLEAKTNLSKLMAAAVAGEEVILANRGKPIVRLVPVEKKPHRTTGFGMWKDKMWVADDWDSPEVNAQINQMFVDAANRYDPLIDPPPKKEKKATRTPKTSAKKRSLKSTVVQKVAAKKAKRQ